MPQRCAYLMERHIKTKSSRLCSIEKADAVVNVLNISLYMEHQKLPKAFCQFNRQQFIEKSFIPNGGHTVFTYIWAFSILVILKEIFVCWIFAIFRVQF